MASRVLLPALVASVAAHGVAMAWLSSGSAAGAGRSDSPGASSPPTPPPRTARELTWLTVDVLPPEPVARLDTVPAPEAATAPATPRVAPATSSKRRATRSGPSVAGPSGSGVAAASTDTGTSGHAEVPVVADDGGGDGPLVLPSAKDLARRLVVDRGPITRSPLAPPRGKPRQPRSEIRPDGKGEYVARDMTFEAAIKRDGRVSITDKPNFWIRLALPRPSTIARGLRDWAEDPYGESPKDERSVETHTVKIVEGGFDLTDWAVRQGGGDPYYHRKKAFFDRTRAERAEMRRVSNAEDLRDAIATLEKDLDRIWRYNAWTRAQRRKALFQIWDDCAERGSKNVLAAARAARATVKAFVRKRLPAGSAHAYPERQLAALNRGRQSASEFRPYD